MPQTMLWISVGVQPEDSELFFRVDDCLPLDLVNLDCEDESVEGVETHRPDPQKAVYNLSKRCYEQSLGFWKCQDSGHAERVEKWLRTIGFRPYASDDPG